MTDCFLFEFWIYYDDIDLEKKRYRGQKKQNENVGKPPTIGHNHTSGNVTSRLRCSAAFVLQAMKCENPKFSLLT